MINNQLWSAAADIVLGYVVGFYFQHRDIEAANRRIDDLYKRIDGASRPSISGSTTCVTRSTTVSRTCCATSTSASRTSKSASSA